MKKLRVFIAFLLLILLFRFDLYYFLFNYLLKFLIIFLNVIFLVFAIFIIKLLQYSFWMISLSPFTIYKMIHERYLYFLFLNYFPDRLTKQLLIVILNFHFIFTNLFKKFCILLIKKHQNKFCTLHKI